MCTAQQFPGALEPGWDWGWPASYCSIIFLLCCCLSFTSCAISNCFSIELPFMSIQLFSDGLLSYDLQIKRCSMVSSLTSQATQRLSLYFHGCHILISNVFDLILKIILLNDVLLLSKRYSLVSSLSKNYILCFFKLWIL